jgi:hypothetical protein
MRSRIWYVLMRESADPSLGRWITNEIIWRKLVKPASYIREIPRFSHIRTYNVDVVELVFLMILDEGLQCSLPS